MTPRLLGHLSPVLHSRYRQAMEALDSLTVGEQIEVACQVLVGILAAARIRSEKAAADQKDYHLLCDAVEGWLEHNVAALRQAGPW